MCDPILVPLDGSTLAECSLPHAVAMASAFKARLVLLRVLTYEGSKQTFADPLDWQLRKSEAVRYLESIQTRLGRLGFSAEYQVLEGHSAQTILDFARRNQSGLIILSSHGRSGLSVWNVSGVVYKIMQRASLPVMVVRAYQEIPSRIDSIQYRHILAPLDTSQRAECVLPLAMQVVDYCRARLSIVHVVTQPEIPRRTGVNAEAKSLADQLTQLNRQEAEHYLEQIRKRLKKEGMELNTHLMIRENVASALHEYALAEQVDLVMMSAHGYSGERYWPYGNVVDKLLTYGATPLFVYQDFRPDELKTSISEAKFRESEEVRS